MSDIVLAPEWETVHDASEEVKPILEIRQTLAQPVDMNAAANVSTDVFVSSGTASLNYGLSAEIGE